MYILCTTCVHIHVPAGPGQAVLYPILNLRQLGRGARAYVEGVEDTVVSALGMCLTFSTCLRLDGVRKDVSGQHYG
jgi:lipoate-protein ligase B